MTTAANQTLRARRNAPFEWRFQVMDGLTPVDITGVLMAMQVRLYGAAAGVALISLDMVTVEGSKGIRIANAAEGRVHIVIPEADISGLPGVHQPDRLSSQSYPYDLRVTPAGGIAEVWAQGLFTVEPGVTKA